MDEDSRGRGEGGVERVGRLSIGEVERRRNRRT